MGQLSLFDINGLTPEEEAEEPFVWRPEIRRVQVDENTWDRGSVACFSSRIRAGFRSVGGAGPARALEG